MGIFCGKIVPAFMEVPLSLLKFKEKFDPQLEKFLAQKIRENGQVDSQLVQVLKETKKIISGGKRIRPAFMFFAYRACGGKAEEAILEACCAIEFFHTFALIHDDIIDNSPLRRGKPTLHRVLGVPTAILVGDLLQTYAWESLSAADFPPAFLQKAQKIFGQLSCEVMAGQYLDIKISQMKLDKINFEKAEKRVFQMLKFKSGKYSVERPCHLGAALAGAPKKVFKVFSDYGIPLGMAFQIQDDILGIFGEEKILGKPVDSDLKEGKVTLLVVKTLEKLTEEKTKKIFLSLWGNKEVTNKDLEWARNLIKKTGALEYSQELAQKLALQAKMAIKSYPFPRQSQDFFLGMADFLKERNY